MSENSIIKCSFCGRSRKDVDKIIAGSEASICNSCVSICNEILQLKNADLNNPANSKIHIPFSTPEDIYKYLDRYIEGHNGTKKRISVAVYVHCVLNNLIPAFKEKNPDIIHQKSSILMIGDTGTGKTLFAKIIAKFLDLPMVVIDATGLTSTGYVGGDVEDILVKLLQAAENDVNKAQRGIIFIDEIDKLAKKTDHSGMRDIAGEDVQQGMLKLLEGSEITISASNLKKNGISTNVTINTSKILIICGGSFVGLKKIVEKRLNKSKFGFIHNHDSTTQVGFNLLEGTGSTEISYKFQQPEDSTQNYVLHQTTTEDLTEFGMIAELLGRLPIISYLEDLKKEQLVSILSKKENCLVDQYKELFLLSGSELDFTTEAIEYIATLAMKKKVGARGLKTVMENTLNNTMYFTLGNVSTEEEKKTILVDLNMVEAAVSNSVI